MKWRIGELLIQKKLITWEQLEFVLQEQQKTREMTGELLIRHGFITPQRLYSALAEQHQIQFVDLQKTHISAEALVRVPYQFAKQYKVMPIEFHYGELVVGVPTPLHVWPENELTHNSDVQVIRKVLCIPEVIDQIMEENYSGIAES